MRTQSKLIQKGLGSFIDSGRSIIQLNLFEFLLCGWNHPKMIERISIFMQFSCSLQHDRGLYYTQIYWPSIDCCKFRINGLPHQPVLRFFMEFWHSHLSKDPDERTGLILIVISRFFSSINLDWNWMDCIQCFDSYLIVILLIDPFVKWVWWYWYIWVFVRRNK
jgi:hypothetical protein